MGVRGALALFAVILLVCHAFVLPAVSSRPLHDELGRELLVSESTNVEATVHESEKLAADQSSLQQVSYSDTYSINVAFKSSVQFVKNFAAPAACFLTLGTIAGTSRRKFR
jgi:hypothetical protein